jgi:hypothetical protein
LLLPTLTSPLLCPRNATARYGSSALGASGLIVILAWLMGMAAAGLHKYLGVDVPQEVQMAIIGIAAGPIIGGRRQRKRGYSSSRSSC